MALTTRALTRSWSPRLLPRVSLPASALSRQPGRSGALYEQRPACALHTSPRYSNAQLVDRVSGDRSNAPDPAAKLRTTANANGSNDIICSWKGRQMQVSPRWLRDACDCSACVDSSSKQKRFATLDIPHDIRAATQEMSPESWTFTWTNDVPGSPTGHSTTIGAEKLDRMLVGVEDWNYRVQRRQWDQSAFLKDCADLSYDEYMQDDQALSRALVQLEQYGLLFLTGLPNDETAINGVVERIGPLKNTFYGLTWDVRSVPQAKNVAYTSGDLDFHMDLMYVQSPPALQFLHCIRSSAKGGASRFTDLWSAVRTLREVDPAAYDVLCNVEVPYEYHNDAQHYFRARPVISDKAEDSRSAVRWSQESLAPRAVLYEELAWSPPFQGTFAADPREGINAYSRTMDAWQDAAGQLKAIFEEPHRIHERMLGSGDCVIFDNRRVLHARTAFDVQDAGKERFLKGAYLDWEVWASRAKALKDKYPWRGENEQEPFREWLTEQSKSAAGAA